MGPKVSVIIPVYGVEQYIERCACSLFEQSLRDIEYIFIDDCTLDNSVCVLQHLVERYRNRLENDNKKVRIEHMSQNMGQALARKFGVLKATGEFVVHCDADDWVDTNMYLEMYTVAQKTRSDIVVCDFAVTDGDRYEKRIKASKTNPQNLLKDCLWGKYSWALWNKLVRRSLYSNVEFPEMSMGEDLATTIQLLLGTTKISYIPKVFYYYYQNNSSTIHQQTVDTAIRKYSQLTENTKLLIKCLEQHPKSTKMVDKLKPYLFMNACVPLIAFFNVSKYMEMWRRACPHLSLWYLLVMPFPAYSKYSYLKYSIKYWLRNESFIPRRSL